MGSIDYVEIPPYATRLQHNVSDEDVRPAPTVTTSLPRSEDSPAVVKSPISASSQTLSPSKIAFNSIPQLLLSSALPVPANAPPMPRTNTKGGPRLLSSRDPLSIPITTVNFKRFVSRVGPVFWLQDRLEEILMWRRGWKQTAVWMAAYAFLCYFPRMVLLLPHATVLGVMIATHPSLRSLDDPDLTKADVPTPQQAQPGEGSVDWLANVQAIQNLMGAFSDVHDYLFPLVPHLTHASSYSSVLLSFLLLTFPALILVATLLPIRPTFLVLGLFPFFCTHPFTRLTLFPVLCVGARPLSRALRVRAVRVVDDDKLDDKHWQAEMREVELYENERWSASAAGSTGSSGGGEDGVNADAGWGKANLRAGERKGWTRGRDGWSGLAEDGSGDVSSNLTFLLSPGWSFVETEDWRPDVEGDWIAPGNADDAGWVYTNDSWFDPRPAPPEEWRASGMTRRRRWTRRIYYNGVS